MIILRQISAKLSSGNNQADEIADRVWTFQDVEARYKLVQTEGKVQGGSFLLAGSTTQALDLPSAYDNSKLLWCLISSYGVLRCDVTLVDTTVQKQLIWGTSDTEGVAAFSGYISSISLVNAGTDPVFIEFSFFEQPDLTSMDSYYGNWVTFGENTNNG